MHFDLSEEHLMIQKAAREFAQNELKPGVIERDEHQKFPAEQVKRMGEMGFLGMMVDPKYGGAGIAKGDEKVSIIINHHVLHIFKPGSGWHEVPAASTVSTF